MGAPTERLVDTNGVRLRVVEAGEPGAPVVILAHGFPELAYSWRHQIPALADAGYHVLAPDQRGYGGSSRPEAIEAYDIHRLTADLVGLLDDVGAERAVWVGHDWGAEAGLTDRAAGLVARFAGGEPLADFAAVRLAPVLAPDAEAAGDLVAVRFTGSSVAVLALVAATYTPSVVTHFRLGLGVRNRKCLLCRMSALISA